MAKREMARCGALPIFLAYQQVQSTRGFLTRKQQPMTESSIPLAKSSNRINSDDRELTDLLSKPFLDLKKLTYSNLND